MNKILQKISSFICLALCFCFVLFSGCNNTHTHTHNYSIEKFNISKHWTECSCGEKSAQENHSIKNGKCEKCSLGNGVYKVDDVFGDVIYFGSYPQTEERDLAVKTALLELAGNPIISTEGWTSYGYYEMDIIKDLMYYQDVDYNGQKYRGVYIKNYRPHWTNAPSIPENTYQITNGYLKDQVYWFRYEPLAWTVKHEENGNAILVCNLVVDAGHYGIENGKEFKINYKESVMRAWLNETFYNTTFNNLEKNAILITEVDNSAKTTGLEPNKYECENTFDKVFFLSYVQMRAFFEKDVDREKKATDYAKCQGVLLSATGIGFEGNANWWLRSPTGWHKDSVWHVTAEGHYDYYFHGANSASCGVAPSVQIKL